MRKSDPARAFIPARAAVAVFATVLSLIALAANASASAQSDTQNQTIRPVIGERLVAYMAAEAEGRLSEAASGYTRLLDTSRLTGFERATLLQLRGRAWYELGDTARAIADWRSAIETQALPVEAANMLRLNTGQLLLAEGAYREGVFLMETALTLGAEVNADIAMRLAQGYGQLGDHRSGLRWAELAFDQAQPRQERHYSLLLFYYQALDLRREQLGLIREMVDRWPDEKRYWTSLTSLLAQSGREEEAFEVNAVMYLNGLLDESAEIVRLAQYYAFYDYPYRGGDILQRELNSGRVAPEAETYRLLASLWRQAREWDRALPVLRRVATMTGLGTDYEALGEALYQEAEFSEAEAMFVQALDRGGMARPGDTWTLLGNARYENQDLAGARSAFRTALRYDYARAVAQGWIDFIDQRIAVEAQGQTFIHLTTIEGCENWLVRARRDVVLSEAEFDPTGRRLFALPDECTDYFDPYGLRLPEWEEV